MRSPDNKKGYTIYTGSRDLSSEDGTCEVDFVYTDSNNEQHNTKMTVSMGQSWDASFEPYFEGMGTLKVSCGSSGTPRKYYVLVSVSDITGTLQPLGNPLIYYEVYGIVSYTFTVGETTIQLPNTNNLDSRFSEMNAKIDNLNAKIDNLNIPSLTGLATEAFVDEQINKKLSMETGQVQLTQLSIVPNVNLSDNKYYVDLVVQPVKTATLTLLPQIRNSSTDIAVRFSITWNESHSLVVSNPYNLRSQKEVSNDWFAFDYNYSSSPTTLTVRITDSSYSWYSTFTATYTITLKLLST